TYAPGGRGGPCGRRQTCGPARTSGERPGSPAGAGHDASGVAWSWPPPLPFAPAAVDLVAEPAATVFDILFHRHVMDRAPARVRALAGGRWCRCVCRQPVEASSTWVLTLAKSVPRRVTRTSWPSKCAFSMIETGASGVTGAPPGDDLRGEA